MTLEVVRGLAGRTRRRDPARASGERGGRAAGVPLPLLVLASAAVVAGAVVMLAGAWRTGVSWDETYHVLRMRNFLDSGWYLLDGDLLDGEPGPWEHQQYVYGPVTMLLLQAWSSLCGVAGVGGVPDTAQAYAVRHLGVALLSLVGVGASAALTRLLTGRWAWGLVTAGLLLVLPVWTGHAMFNVKDVPVAAGYTLATLGLALVVVRTGTARAGPVGAAGAVTLLAGAVLAVGTRPGIWPGLALGVAVALAALATARDRRGLAVVVAALVAAYAVLLAVYPAVFSTPVAALLGSALESSRFGGTVGHRWYLPLFILVEVPLGHLVLALAGSAVLLRRLHGTGIRPEPRGVVALLVGLQCFALPVLAVLRQSNIYTGVRQMLFAAPVTAVLATVGLAALLAAHRRAERAVNSRLVPVGVGLVVLVPLLAQLQLFPYSYAYSTVSANLASPVVERATGFAVPTDYWRTSVRELAPRVPVGGWVTCSPATDGEGRALRNSRESHESCATDPVGPLAPYDGLRSGTWDGAPTRFLEVETGGRPPGSNCSRIAEVSRRLYWRRVEMSHVAVCDLVLPAYPDGGLDLDEGRGAVNLLGGWDLHASDPGAGVRDGGADLGFVLPDGAAARVARGEPVTLAGAALGVAGASAVVNGVPVDLAATGGSGFLLEVPASAAAACGDGRLVLGLRDDGDLRLLSLAIVEVGSR